MHPYVMHGTFFTHFPEPRTEIPLRPKQQYLLVIFHDPALSQRILRSPPQGICILSFQQQYGKFLIIGY